MAGINFGGIIKEGNKTIMNDTAGIGLDTAKLIEGQLAPQSNKIQEIQDTVDLNVKKLAAYSDLETVLCNLKQISDSLKNDTQNNPLLDNLFDSKATIIQNSDGSLPNTYIEVIAGGKCPTGKYDITVSNVATANHTISDPFSSNSTDVTGVGAGRFTIGTFYINTNPVTISSGDTLVNIASKISLIQKTTNVQAYVMRVSASDYRLVMQSTNTGIANSFVISDPGSVLSNITFTNTPAQDAAMTFNAIPFSSPLDIIEDVIDGMTINLHNTTPSSIVSHVSVDYDSNSIDAGLRLLQDQYNQYIDLYIKQTAKKANDPYTLDDNAVLGKEPLFNLIYDQILNIMTSSVINPYEPTYINLASVGINVISSNANFIQQFQDLKFSYKMDIDFYQFNTTLSSDFTKVRDIFATNFSSSSSLFGLLGTPPNLTINEFSIDVDLSRTASPVQASYVQGATTYNLILPYTVLSNNLSSSNDLQINGLQGSVLEGLELIFRDPGTGIGQTNIFMTQGLCDRLSNFLDETLNQDSGSIQIAKQNLFSLNDDNTQNMQNQEMKMNQDRDRLVNQYAQLQSKVLSYNRQIDSMKAWERAKNSK